ncbi:MAG: hypothetical protein ACP5JG_15560 [Anaerolineae bacterium]
MMMQERSIPGMLLVAACWTILLGGCGQAVSTSVPVTATKPVLPGAQPSPSPMLGGTIDRPSDSTGTPSPVQVSDGDNSAWEYYPSLNEVSSLAFGPAGDLWAGTSSGVVHWTLGGAPGESSVAHHVFDACADGRSIAACGPESHLVHDILVTPEGTVWAATTGGVRRLEDNGSWATYTVDDGLPDRVGVALALAPDRTLWVGTLKGLASFNAEKWTTYPDAPGYGNAVWSVDVAPSGLVWFTTHGEGVAAHDPEAGTWRTYSTESGFQFPNARVLALDPDGLPWVHIGYDNVYSFDGASWKVAYPSGGGQWVCDFAFSSEVEESQEGGPYIATCGGFHARGGGVAYPDDGGWSHLTVADGLLQNNVSAVGIGPNGELAVGTRLGVSVRREGQWRTLRHGPTLREVTTVAVTSDGVWLGFGDASSQPIGAGLARLDGEAWFYVDGIGSHGTGASVRTLSVDPRGTLWAGAGCVLARREATGWTTVGDCDSLSGNVRTITFEPETGVGWLATDFDVYGLEDERLAPYKSLVPVALAAGPTETPGGSVWVARAGLAGGGVLAFDGTSWVMQTLPISIVSSMAIGRDGVVWVTGESGLLQYDGDAWTEVAEGRRLYVAPAGFVGGELWGVAGTRIGYLVNGAWNDVVDLGVPVLTLAFAGDESLWVGTPLGLVAVRR